MDDMNDIRLAIGALTNRVKTIDENVTYIREHLDDIGAVILRAARLGDVFNQLDEVLDEAPARLRATSERVKTDAMLSMVAGIVCPFIEGLADDIDAANRVRRQGRPAPAVEH